MFIKYQSIISPVVCTQNDDHILHRLCDNLNYTVFTGFLFKTIHLKVYWLCFSLKKKSASPIYLYVTLCGGKLMGWVLSSFMDRLIRTLNQCMHHCPLKIQACQIITWVWLRTKKFWLGYVTQTACIIICNKFDRSHFCTLFGGEGVE